MLDTCQTVLESSYIPATLASVRKVFATLLRWEVEAEPKESGVHFEPAGDVSGIIAFTGVLNGTIVISFDKEIAFAAVEALLGDKPTEITGDVCDAVAELANMVAGGVKDQLEFDDIQLGMPATVSGTGHCVKFDSGASVERALIKTPGGCLTIQIAVRPGKVN